MPMLFVMLTPVFHLAFKSIFHTFSPLQKKTPTHVWISVRIHSMYNTRREKRELGITHEHSCVPLLFYWHPKQYHIGGDIHKQQVLALSLGFAQIYLLLPHPA